MTTRASDSNPCTFCPSVHPSIIYLPLHPSLFIILSIIYPCIIHSATHLSICPFIYHPSTLHLLMPVFLPINKQTNKQKHWDNFLSAWNSGKHWGCRTEGQKWSPSCQSLTLERSQAVNKEVAAIFRMVPEAHQVPGTVMNPNVHQLSLCYWSVIIPTLYIRKVGYPRAMELA
jgi:hypothetical protein